MTTPLRLTLIQANPVVGDIVGNLNRLLQWFEEYRGLTDLMILPELYLTGYPPRDLLLREAFLQELDDGIARLLEASRANPALAILVGTPRPGLEPGLEPDLEPGLEPDLEHGPEQGDAEAKTRTRMYNAALLIADGAILLEQHKALLPIYDVFDELRYFDVAREHQVVSFSGHKLGVCICEDAWNVDDDARVDCSYDYDPVAALVEEGAEVILNLSASPFHQGKEQLRYRIGLNHVHRHGVAFVLVNQVGANDELIFDGCSFALAKNGDVLAALPSFEEAQQTFELTEKAPAQSTASLVRHATVDNIRSALVLGISDYFAKTGAKTALIGLSGGIDSAVVACLATEALGAENVYGVTMPGTYSSTGSWQDSKELAARLKIHFDVLPITNIFEEFLSALAPFFQDLPADTAEENVQARIRGSLLMAIANKHGHLVLATSNKSEMSVGYATLYGDMVGALAVIADVFKMQVYELAHSYNRQTPLVPESILTKPPSAELKEDQKDSDSLPPYDLLDAIVRLYVEEAASPEEIIAAGYASDVVTSLVGRIRQNEYKRWQAPPVLRVTPKGFGTGRRIPLAARYRV